MNRNNHLLMAAVRANRIEHMLEVFARVADAFKRYRLKRRIDHDFRRLARRGLL